MHPEFFFLRVIFLTVQNIHPLHFPLNCIEIKLHLPGSQSGRTLLDTFFSFCGGCPPDTIVTPTCHYTPDHPSICQLTALRPGGPMCSADTNWTFQW